MKYGKCTKICLNRDLLCPTFPTTYNTPKCYLSKMHYQISNRDNSHLKRFHFLNNNSFKCIQLSSLTRYLFNKQDVENNLLWQAVFLSKRLMPSHKQFLEK